MAPNLRFPRTPAECVLLKDSEASGNGWRLPHGQPCLVRDARLYSLVRKSQTAISLAQKTLRRYASKLGAQLQPETLVYAQDDKFFIYQVFTCSPCVDRAYGAVRNGSMGKKCMRELS